MEDGIGWCMQHVWKEEKCILSFGWGNLEEQERPLGRPRFRWQDIIKMFFGELARDCVDQFHMTEDQFRRKAVLNTETSGCVCSRVCIVS